MQLSTDIAQSDWLAQRLHDFDHTVAAVVPDGFPAYVRILHPAFGKSDAAVSWAFVAAASGRLMHPLVQFHSIAQPAKSAEPGLKAWDGRPPRPGNLAPNLLHALCAVLSPHTNTPNSCWFCLWEGYGWLDATSPASELHDAPRVRLPNRNYVLYSGPLSSVGMLGWRSANGAFFPQSPNIFWPADHAWCVASEIDLFCTMVAGSEALAEALMSDSNLETWRVSPQASIASTSDAINT